MVSNRIKVMRTEVDISATALAEKMPEGVDKIVMSYIEKGRVLPTRDGLEAMCNVFGCIPTDIYNATDIDLLAVKRKPEQPPTKTPEADKVKAVSNGDETKNISLSCLRSHEGMKRIYLWINPEEKAALLKAIQGLGYHSVTEWLREMYRVTLHKYISLNLKGKVLHESIPPTIQDQTI